MRNLHLIALASAFLISCLATGASAAIVPDKLSLQDAVSLALRVNVNLKQADTARLDSVAGLRKAQVFATFGAGVTSGLDRTPDQRAMSNNVFGSLDFAGLLGTKASMAVTPFGNGLQRGSMTLSLTHPLMKGTGRFSDRYDLVQSAVTDIGVQNKGYYVAQQSTVLNVVQAYYGAVVAREQVGVQAQAAKLAEETAIYMKKREEAGLERGIDVTRSEVYAAQAKDDLNRSQQTARAAVDALMIAMGFGVGQTPELIDPIPEAQPEIPSLDEAIKTATNNRSELSVYDMKLNDARRKLSIKTDQLRAGLDLVAKFDSSNPDPGVISTSLLNAGSMNVGLVLNMPLDRRLAREDRDVSARAVDTLKEQKSFEMEQIANDVRSAYRSLDSARISYGIFSQNLAIAKENLHIAQRMEEEGEGDSRDVVSAQQSLTGVQSSILSAKSALYLAAISLKYTMGEDITVMGSK